MDASESSIARDSFLEVPVAVATAVVREPTPLVIPTDPMIAETPSTVEGAPTSVPILPTSVVTTTAVAISPTPGQTASVTPFVVASEDSFPFVGMWMDDLEIILNYPIMSGELVIAPPCLYVRDHGNTPEDVVVGLLRLPGNLYAWDDQRHAIVRKYEDGRSVEFSNGDTVTLGGSIVYYDWDHPYGQWARHEECGPDIAVMGYLLEVIEQQ
ncbi:hypothetical protein [Candidatus Poriferisocius sp.]|uniref:hypothetical protein n=1 Tax=Candidatus Poriferisocius sp. TaxID=3101276 RepID=UPI003B5C11A1